MSIVRKLLLAVGGRIRRHLSDDLEYEISRYVFRNPIKLKLPLLAPCRELKLDLRVTYLLVKDDKDSCDS